MDYFTPGNVFVRQMPFEKAGDQVQGHRHNFDHVTYVVRGGLRIERLDDDGNVLKVVEKRARDGFNWLLIEAGKVHRITALEDKSLGHCIYAHRNAQGEVVQEYDGWMPAYV